MDRPACLPLDGTHHAVKRATSLAVRNLGSQLTLVLLQMPSNCVVGGPKYRVLPGSWMDVVVDMFAADTVAAVDRPGVLVLALEAVAVT